MRVSEICVKRLCVNQGLGVLSSIAVKQSEHVPTWIFWKIWLLPASLVYKAKITYIRAGSLVRRNVNQKPKHLLCVNSAYKAVGTVKFLLPPWKRLCFWRDTFVFCFQNCSHLLFEKNVLKSSLFSNGHRAAWKMNLFYYRGCVNHNFNVPPK